MSDSLTLKAFAKINLNLDITGVSGNKQYHTVEMVLQTVDIYDTVTVSREDNEITVQCSNDELSNENNIAFIAAKAFFDFSNILGGACIKIKKRIPQAAGLGGGSTDAAAVIVALNKLYETNFDNETLEKIAEEVGSDVPFFISGGTQLAEGRGTILTPLPDLPECAFVIVKDGYKPSTGEMYKRFDEKNDVIHPVTSDLVEAICEGDLFKASENMQNVFESLYESNFLKLKDELIENGAICSALSGSGPSIFGLFKDIDTAKDAKDILEDKYSEVFVCEPTKVGYED